MTVTIQRSVSLELVTCYSCGVIFGLPDDLYRNRLDDQKQWYCPNGHGQHFIGETDAAKYERLWKTEQNRLAAERSQHDQTKASLTATRGVVTKLRKRAITGTCAFCHRHFVDVERHVATKHSTETP